MDMAYDEVDRVSTALEVISVAGVAFRAVSAFSTIAKAERAMASFAKQAEVLSGLSRASRIGSIGGKLRALTGAGISRAVSASLIRGGVVCFVAGTQIPVENGMTKAIELIQPGDMVLSRDMESGVEGYKPVLRIFVTHPDVLVHVTFDGGTNAPSYSSEVVGTPEHPIWKQDTGWVNLGSLCIGDYVRCANDRVARVKTTWREHSPQGAAFTTYNFEVVDWHTYFVQTSEGAVWVHNTCKFPGRAGKQARLRELANDPSVSSADRGWLQQELNAIASGKRTSIRLPPFKVLAHRRGFEAAKGFSYKYSDLQDVDLHKLQHLFEGY